MQLGSIAPVTAVRGNCKQRFSLPRSVGILRCDGSGVSAAHLAL